jgi:hypothetical protein
VASGPARAVVPTNHGRVGAATEAPTACSKTPAGQASVRQSTAGSASRSDGSGVSSRQSHSSSQSQTTPELEGSAGVRAYLKQRRAELRASTSGGAVSSAVSGSGPCRSVRIDLSDWRDGEEACDRGLHALSGHGDGGIGVRGEGARGKGARDEAEGGCACGDEGGQRQVELEGEGVEWSCGSRS